jgi:DNA replication protein DnaD
MEPGDVLSGYIRLYRCLLKKSVWKQSTPEQKVILITLLLMANHNENEWLWSGEKFKCLPGQMVTSLESITKACGKGISIQNVRSALLKFEKLDFLTNQSTKTGRLLTIVNWELYQDEILKPTKEPTNDQQRGNKEVTTNKNDKNDKNKNIYTPEFESFLKEYPNGKEKNAAFTNWKKRLKEGHTAEEMIKAAINYASHCKKNNTESKYIKLAKNFLGRDKTFLDYLNTSGSLDQGRKESLEERALNGYRTGDEWKDD